MQLSRLRAAPDMSHRCALCSTFVWVWTWLLLGCSALPAQFVRPSGDDGPRVWGVEDGIVVGLHPDFRDPLDRVGPRGLLRIGLMREGVPRLVNFVAVEPLVAGKRGLSELERGGDGEPGKRMWVSDRRSRIATAERQDLRGKVSGRKGSRQLQFVIHVEPFANGARPIVEVTLFEEQPDRVRFRTWLAEGSAEVEQLTLTATMGNMVRGRNLWLEDAPVHSVALYGGYRGHGFVEHDPYGLDALHRTRAGDIVVALTPDEFVPAEIWPFEDGGWRSPVPWAAQFWLKPKGTFDASLHCRVNGRRTYWRSRNPLPCGVAFENFELREDFAPGQETWFGMTDRSPGAMFEFGYDLPPNAVVEREVDDAERARIASAGPLANGDFAAGLDDWVAQPGAAAFRLFEEGGEARLTTFAAKRDADRGTLSQCFRVPDDAHCLRFWLHGGCDPRSLRVQLWDGERLVRWATGRNDNQPVKVEFSLREHRGRVLTLEIVDDSDGRWGLAGDGRGLRAGARGGGGRAPAGRWDLAGARRIGW
ncbi:MAG: hypothetical protein KDB80_05790 [Planctomycetes bacterium]|nr:hypothetical protein [Planctomycetota bacterium]